MWFPSSKTCSACGTVNPNLKREPRWTCPSCGAQHERNLNAAINLRNLIVAPNSRRNGRGQEAVVQPKPRHSSQGEPGIVKDVLALRDRGLGNNRNLDAAINPSNFVVPSGRHRDGRGREDDGSRTGNFGFTSGSTR